MRYFIEMPFSATLIGHQFDFDRKRIDDWLNSNIGKEEIDWRWYYLSPVHTWQFEFNTKENQVKFILRWL